jgi:hypothetical protein
MLTLKTHELCLPSTFNVYLGILSIHISTAPSVYYTTRKDSVQPLYAQTTRESLASVSTRKPSTSVVALGQYIALPQYRLELRRHGQHRDP